MDHHFVEILVNAIALFNKLKFIKFESTQIKG